MNDQKKTAYLLDEIGRISDLYVAEAAQPKPKRQTATLYKYLGMAACILVVCTLLLRIWVLVGGMPKGEDSQSPTVSDGVRIPLDAYLAQNEHLFQNVTVLGGRDHAGAGELLSYFDGNAYLVWQKENSDTLSQSRPLTAHELEALQKELGRGEEIDSTLAQQVSCRVWILLGDGRVISPYLEATSGNVGYGTIFDYNAECIPSTTFTSLVSDILEGN